MSPLNRRQFLAASAAALATGSNPQDVATTQPTTRPPSSSPASRGATTGTNSSTARVADAGSVAGFNADQVYDEFREDGFFVIRREGKLFALSSICTHRGCKVRAQPDTSFTCKCHGSNFSPEGRVLNGPATRDLPRLKVATDDRAHLLVKLD